MATEFSINALVADLRPVGRRTAARDAALLAGVAGAELAAWLLLGFARPDLGEAMRHPALQWKLGGLLVLSLLAGASAVLSFTPERSPRGGLGWTATVGLALLMVAVIGGVIGGTSGSMDVILTRLDWHHGLMCVEEMTALSVVPAMVLGLLARRGAPTDLRGSALACGLTAAAWGAFVFAFACPSDDPLYTVVWYLVGSGATVLVTQALIVRLARW